MDNGPVTRLTKRESARLIARMKREEILKAGEQFWDEVQGRTYDNGLNESAEKKAMRGTGRHESKKRVRINR